MLSMLSRSLEFSKAILLMIQQSLGLVRSKKDVEQEDDAAHCLRIRVLIISEGERESVYSTYTTHSVLSTYSNCSIINNYSLSHLKQQ